MSTVSVLNRVFPSVTGKKNFLKPLNYRNELDR
jgi:hypothetical protein